VKDAGEVYTDSGSVKLEVLLSPHLFIPVSPATDFMVLLCHLILFLLKSTLVLVAHAVNDIESLLTVDGSMLYRCSGEHHPLPAAGRCRASG
jgi:hypothetical protein